MNQTNEQDVRAQLESIGLILEPGALRMRTDGRSVRCRVDGCGVEKRGWYRLSEWAMDSGTVMLVGTYGIFQGDDAGTRKIELTKRCDECGYEMALKEKKCPKCDSTKHQKRELTQEQKDALRAKQAEDKKRADAERKGEINRAASWAGAVWRKCREAAPADHDYFARKHLASTGGARIFDGNDGLELPGAQPEDYIYLGKFKGALAVPMCDTSGKVYGLQFILSREIHKERIRQTERDKEFWPAGMSAEAKYWLVGGTPNDIGLICEGYATGISLQEATGRAVAIAFTAGNLGKVAAEIKKHYRKQARYLVCADDDWLQKCAECTKYTPVATATCAHCGKPHRKANAGVARAAETALAVPDCDWLKPTFAAGRPSDKKGPTDFNDLHCLEGLNSVRAQIEARVDALGWSASAPALVERGVDQGGEGEKLKPLISIDEAAERFALIYGLGGKSLFDHQEYRVVHKDEMLNITPERAWADVKRHPSWRVYRDSEVGFDPDGSQPEIICNLYSGWPTKPKKGKFTAILDLLAYLCSNETDHASALLKWTLCWLAYPIQNPGAKMQTAMIVHGDQGAGKNTFFSRVYRPIYGKYSVEFGQTAMEEKFNGWMSGKLFGVGNEVIASREELYHVKGKIKNMITESSWQIRSMHQDARMERNCCNFVFFSNDLNALHLDPHDRRFCVIWTPHTPQPGKDNYAAFKLMMAEVHEEIENGGSEAFHEYLLRVDLEGFGVATPPPMTKAKEALIELNLDSKERFLREWMSGSVGEIPFIPIPIDLLYELYREWCPRFGMRNASPMHTLAALLYSKPGVTREQTKIQIDYRSERKTVIYVEGMGDHPPDKTKSVWLGECAETFKTKLDAWRGEKSWK